MNITNYGLYSCVYWEALYLIDYGSLTLSYFTEKIGLDIGRRFCETSASFPDAFLGRVLPCSVPSDILIGNAGLPALAYWQRR